MLRPNGVYSPARFSLATFGPAELLIVAEDEDA
jgi:hypothetical protein